MIPLDMTPIVMEFAYPGGLTIEVPGVQTVDALGQVTDPAPTTTLFDPIAVHTASTKDLLRLPEADRTNETIVLYTITALVTSGATRPNVVQYNSRRWEVHRVADHQAQGGVWQSFAQLIQVTT